MSEDLRVIKTRSNIRKEFLSLLQQYEFRAITVSMIIERCQINRSTFYRNYEDKYALTDAIVQDLLEEFSRNMETAFIRESKAEPGSFNSMLEYFSQHRKELTLLYQRVLPVNLFDQMLTRYSEALLKETSRIFPNSVLLHHRRHRRRGIPAHPPIFLLPSGGGIWKALRLPDRRWRKLSV